jgi:hypothetical protein
MTTAEKDTFNMLKLGYIPISDLMVPYSIAWPEDMKIGILKKTFCEEKFPVIFTFFMRIEEIDDCVLITLTHAPTTGKIETLKEYRVNTRKDFESVMKEWSKI